MMIDILDLSGSIFPKFDPSSSIVASAIEQTKKMEGLMTSIDND